MGRVAKYKKIKSFDPYSKQNRGSFHANGVIWGMGENGQRQKKRSRTAERLKTKNKKSKKEQNLDNDGSGGFDLPPSAKDEFDMSDLMGSVRKEKVEEEDKLDSKPSAVAIASMPTVSSSASSNIASTSATGNTATLPETAEDERKVAKLLNLDQQLEQKKKDELATSMQRLPGESKRAYQKRTHQETRQIIHKTTVKRNVEKLQKKKEFLKQKKKQKKNGNNEKRGVTYYDEDGDYQVEEEEPVFVTGERAIAALKAKEQQQDDPVVFGEQVERPPIFRQLPRGAQKKQTQTTNSKSDVNTATTTTMSEQKIRSESNAMEQLRRKVQAQYAMVRSKRRADGERFHL